jgi:HAD superfamily 5'-nucleotidase-like hydrolase
MSIDQDAARTTPMDGVLDEPSKRYAGEILCNRGLNMKRIKAIGFDMDYTLAQYIPETFEILAHRGAMAKLVDHMGYPKEILELPDYDPTSYQRGLMIDKVRGNIIKMDRHMYCKIAYHGTMPMSKTERTLLYGSMNQKDYSSGKFANIDTLFSLPDAFMFAHLVTFVDEHRDTYPVFKGKSYEQIYKDVRKAVDLCHRDGVIKDRVAEDPGRYIQQEPGIIDMLKRYRSSGRKVFLLTNSLWDYTHVVMNHINGFSKPEERNLDWLDLFDLVIVGGGKPTFLEDENLPIFRVHPEDQGRLSNMDNALFDPPEVSLAAGKVFQGGNFNHLHHLLGDTVLAGEQIVYVGDHMFSDVIRGKRSLGWRTVLVVPELEQEVDVELREAVLRRRVMDVRELRDELDEWVDRLSMLLVSCDNDETKGDLTARRDSIEKELLKAQSELLNIKHAFSNELREYHEKFHPIWGQVFKVGYQNSRFAQQVQTYSCLYTSKVSNLGLVSPEINFRTQEDLMPHDRLEDTPIRRIIRARARDIVESLGQAKPDESMI